MKQSRNRIVLEPCDSFFASHLQAIVISWESMARQADYDDIPDV